MKTATKERFEIINFIINTIGDKGREISIEYLSDLFDEAFPNKFKNTSEAFLYFKSQINLLSEDYSLTRINKNLIGLTEKGIEAYELEDGFYSYLEQRDKAIRISRLSSKISIASSIATIFATFIAAFTLWLTYGAFQMKTTLIIFGVSCSILGFGLRGLIISLLKFRLKRSNNTILDSK